MTGVLSTKGYKGRSFNLQNLLKILDGLEDFS